MKDRRVCGVYQRFRENRASPIYYEGGRRLHNISYQTTKEFPLVSIITVCLNSNSTIEQCIESVRSQTYTNIEYIIIDGGSRDGTVNKAKKYESSTIDYILSQKDSGLYDAMNKGLALARGEYILLLNSDDWYEPDCVELLIKAAMETNAGVVSALANYVDANGKCLYTTAEIGFDPATRMRNPLRHETMLLSAELYNKYGPYDTNYKVIADFHFILKLYEQGVSHHLVKKGLLNFRNTGASSVNMNLLFAERKKLLLSQFPYLTPDDVETLSVLQTLTKSAVESILRRYRIHPKLYTSLYVLTHKSWKLPDINISIKPSFQGKNRYIRIETLCTNTSGGAGTGSKRRVTALKAIGLDVHLNGAFITSPKERKLTSSLYPNLGWMDFINSRAVITRKNTPSFAASEIFSTDHSVFRMTDFMDVSGRADVLHFHWMAGILDYDGFDLLRNKPIVWTLADMAVFTGGCHYSEGCTRYETGCHNCPLIGAERWMPNRVFESKRKAYAELQNLHIVCPSQWLANLAQKSPLLTNARIHTIPNPLPLWNFYPINKIVAQGRLGIPPGKKYILFGAEDTKNRRKGGNLLIEAIEKLRSSISVDSVAILTFGEKGIRTPFNQIDIGKIKHIATMRAVYSAATLFAFPSREDNAPLTVAESLACGTPVVAFPVGNVSDLIAHRQNGYIAKYLDTSDLAEGILWVLNQRQDDFKLTLKCISKVREYNDPMKSAQSHKKLYQSIV